MPLFRSFVSMMRPDIATNFYLSQHDMNKFSELYIVRKGCTKAWAAAHKELDFARAII